MSNLTDTAHPRTPHITERDADATMSDFDEWVLRFVHDADYWVEPNDVVDEWVCRMTASGAEFPDDEEFRSEIVYDVFESLMALSWEDPESDKHGPLVHEELSWSRFSDQWTPIDHVFRFRGPYGPPRRRRKVSP